MNKRKLSLIFLCLGIVLLLVGLALLGVGVLSASNVGIIGGADGPTVVLVSFHRYGGFCFWSVFVGVVSIIAAAVLHIVRKKRRT